MKTSVRLALAGAAAILAWYGDALAQTAQPLPDVNVTASAPIKRVNPFNPFSGDTRVDDLPTGAGPGGATVEFIDAVVPLVKARWRRDGKRLVRK